MELHTYYFVSSRPWPSFTSSSFSPDGWPPWWMASIKLSNTYMQCCLLAMVWLGVGVTAAAADAVDDLALVVLLSGGSMLDLPSRPASTLPLTSLTALE